MVKEINELINKKIVNIKVMGDTEIIFKCDNGDKYKMFHERDCCEDVRIEDISGNLDDLLNYHLIMAEEATEKGGDRNNCESFTWTFYKFATVMGYVTIRWYGTSNGYYSERVDIKKMN